MELTEQDLVDLKTYYDLETKVSFIETTLKNELLDRADEKRQEIELANGAKLVLTKKDAGTKKQFNTQRFKEEVDDFERFYDTVETKASVSVKYMG